jgi:KaiC/GvpD/RAD55 family RecA-like ATPase
MGKQVLTNLFIADGLKRGVPAIYVVTDKTPKEVINSLRPILPNVEAFEKKGLLFWVDTFSRGMGLPEDHPNTKYVDKVTDLDGMTEAILEIQGGIKANYHKLVFHSVSTLLTYNDPTSTFRFLQNLTARSRWANCAALYIIDEGMQSDGDVATLKHLMNGMVEFKQEELKSYMRVEGICDIRTRGWVEYSHTTSSLNLLGSFAVNYIK